MSIAVKPPFESFLDLDGKPLDAGYVYIGEVSLDPETYPVAIFYDRQQTVSAPNPFRTVAGFPALSGSPTAVYCAGSYSITVRDRNGVLIYTAPINTDDSGSGASGGSGKNYIANPSFEDGTTTGWNLGRDPGTTAPTAGGIGAGASQFLPLTFNSTSPLSGSASLTINKPTGNTQGSTLYTDNLTLELEDLTRNGYLGFTYRTPASGYTSGDLAAFLWDVEGAALVALSTNAIPGTAGAAGEFSASFTPTANAVYRVILMLTNASNISALAIDVDSFYLGPNAFGDSGVVMDTDATLAANSDTRIATQKAVKAFTLPLSYLDTDGTLAANSDVKVASQKAVKTYVDTKQDNLGLTYDYRATSGATRTEVFSPMLVGQRFMIEWQLTLTGTTNLTFQLPAGGTYNFQVLVNVNTTGNASFNPVVTPISFFGSSVPGGTSGTPFTSQTGGQTVIVTGFIKRVS